MAKQYTGWGEKGKAFTRKQFLKSVIRKSYGGSRYSYKQYLKDINPRSARLKKFLRTAMK